MFADLQSITLLSMFLSALALVSAKFCPLREHLMARAVPPCSLLRNSEMGTGVAHFIVSSALRITFLSCLHV